MAGVPVEIAVAAGIEPGAAVRAALGMSIVDFCELYDDLRPDVISAILSGSVQYPYNRHRDALVEHLGTTREWLDRNLPVKEAVAEGEG
ncbi:MAG: hypothetical protein ACLFWG_07850 [Longimicrobiales bacterium]